MTGVRATLGTPTEVAEPSFLLLKPDCLRDGMRAAVEAEVRLAGLAIRCRHELTLTPGDVRYLWTEYTDRDHVLALGFLDRYLCRGTAEVLFVTGPDAFEAARRVKRTVRKRHAKGVFSNVLHAAETRSELARQGARLLGRCAVCTVALPANGATPNPLRPPGIAFSDEFDVPALIDEMWARLSDGLPAPPPVLLGTRECAVFLGVDSDNSLDSAVNAVWRSLPGIDVRTALAMALHAGRSGGYALALGPRAEVQRCYERLRELGIKNTWCGPPGP